MRELRSDPVKARQLNRSPVLLLAFCCGEHDGGLELELFVWWDVYVKGSPCLSLRVSMPPNKEIHMRLSLMCRITSALRAEQCWQDATHPSCDLPSTSQWETLGD